MVFFLWKIGVVGVWLVHFACLLSIWVPILGFLSLSLSLCRCVHRVLTQQGWLVGFGIMFVDFGWFVMGEFRSYFANFGLVGLPKGPRNQRPTFWGHSYGLKRDPVDSLWASKKCLASLQESEVQKTSNSGLPENWCRIFRGIGRRPKKNRSNSPTGPHGILTFGG